MGSDDNPKNIEGAGGERSVVDGASLPSSMAYGAATKFNEILQPVMTLTAPERERRHVVSDDQLERLCSNSEDTSKQWFFGFFFASLTLSQNFWNCISAANSGKAPETIDLFLGTLFGGVVVGAIVTNFYSRRNKSESRALLEKIRTQKEHEL